MGLVVPLEEKTADTGIRALIDLAAADMARVDETILSRAASHVSMIPDIARHLIASGGKRLRPMLTLATSNLCDYSGAGHIKLAAAVEFMHTATLLHDDVVAKTAALFGAACEVGAILGDRSKAEAAACRDYGVNLGIAFQLIDDALDYGGTAATLGKNVGDDFREGKITLPVVLAFRRGSEAERAFWRRALEEGSRADGDLDLAVAALRRHRALEDTVERARHYGAMACDALGLFPDSRWKRALTDVVAFCVDRSH